MSEPKQPVFEAKQVARLGKWCVNINPCGRSGHKFGISRFREMSPKAAPMGEGDFFVCAQQNRSVLDIVRFGCAPINLYAGPAALLRIFGMDPTYGLEVFPRRSVASFLPATATPTPLRPDVLTASAPPSKRNASSRHLPARVTLAPGGVKLAQYKQKSGRHPSLLTRSAPDLFLAGKIHYSPEVLCQRSPRLWAAMQVQPPTLPGPNGQGACIVA
jgi:hypothetical protein